MTEHLHDVSSGEDAADEPQETDCKRCRGTGEDRDGADCRHCEGYGTVLSVIGITVGLHT